MEPTTKDIYFIAEYGKIWENILAWFESLVEAIKNFLKID